MNEAGRADLAVSSRKRPTAALLRAALATMVAVMLMTASAAAANADTLTTSVANASPSRDAPTSVTLSWAASPTDVDNGLYLYAVSRPSSDGGCASTFGADPGSGGAANDDTLYDGTSISYADSSTTATLYPQVGSYTVCAWLETDSWDYSGSSDTSSVVTAQAAPVSFTGRDTDTASISLSNTKASLGNPVTVTVSGNASPIDSGGDGVYVYAVARPASDGACASTYGSDPGSSNGTTLINGSQVAPGSFTVSDSFSPSSTGTDIVCAWLETVGYDSSGSGNTSQNVTATASSAQLTVVDTDTLSLALSSPKPTIGKTFTVKAGGKASPIDSNGNGPYLYVVVRPYDGVGCAATYGSDPGVSDGIQLIDSSQVAPSSFTASASTTAASGRSIVCAWLEDSSYDYSGDGLTSQGVYATASKTFTAVKPPVPAACIVPRYTGANLATVKKRLKADHCEIGRITYKRDNHVRKNLVITLAARPGKKLAHNAKVAITVSKGR